MSGKVTQNIGRSSGLVKAPASAIASSILQIKSTTKTTSFTTTSTSYTDVTGYSVSITPSSTSNYILLLGSYVMGADNLDGGLGFIKFLRGTTDLLESTDSGSYGHAYSHHESNDAFAHFTTARQSVCIFDNPSSTSSVTYKAQARTNDATNSFVFNRSGRSDTNADYPRMASQLIALEIDGGIIS